MARPGRFLSLARGGRGERRAEHALLAASQLARVHPLQDVLRLAREDDARGRLRRHGPRDLGERAEVLVEPPRGLLRLLGELGARRVRRRAAAAGERPGDGRRGPRVAGRDVERVGQIRAEEPGSPP